MVLSDYRDLEPTRIFKEFKTVTDLSNFAEITRISKKRRAKQYRIN
jgi:hypothetical protein